MTTDEKLDEIIRQLKITNTLIAIKLGSDSIDPKMTDKMIEKIENKNGKWK